MRETACGALRLLGCKRAQAYLSALQMRVEGDQPQAHIARPGMNLCGCESVSWSERRVVNFNCENNEISEADRCRENCKPVQKQSLAIANDGQNFPIVASSGSKEKPFGDDESDRKAERTSDGIDLIRANLGVDGDRGFGTERESDEKSKCERANSDQVAVRTCKSYRTSIGSVAARDGVEATSGD